MIRSLLLSALFASLSIAQIVNQPNTGGGGVAPLTSAGAPTNPCLIAGQSDTDTVNHVLYICNSAGGSWFMVGSVNVLAAIPYSGNIPGVITVSVLAANHGQGSHPQVTVVNNATPPHVVQADVSIAANGDVVMTFNPAFTGVYVIYGGTGGFSNPMTTRDQTIVQGASGPVAVAAPINVLAYGVVCDGATDDSTALSYAIAAAPAAGTILLPAGVCMIGARVVLNSGKRLGSPYGYAATTLRATSGNTTGLIQITGQYSEVWGMTLDQAGFGSPASQLEITGEVYGTFIHDNYFLNTPVGSRAIYGNDPAGPNGIGIMTIQRNYFAAISGEAIYMNGGGDSVQIIDNAIGYSANLPGYAIWWVSVNGASHVNIRQNNITGGVNMIRINNTTEVKINENQIEQVNGPNNNPQGAMIYLENTSGCQIEGNNMNMYGNATTGIYFNNVANNCVVRHNNFSFTAGTPVTAAAGSYGICWLDNRNAPNPTVNSSAFTCPVSNVDAGSGYVEATYHSAPDGGIGGYENLVTNSEIIGSTGWVLLGTETATQNSTVAPDGNTTATKLMQNGTTVGSSTLTSAVPVSVTGPYTFSFWAKSGNSSKLGYQIYDQTAGVLSSNYNFMIASEWKRYSFTATAVAGHIIDFYLYADSNTGVTAGNYVYVWGAQVTQANLPKVYAKTTGSAIAANHGIRTNGSISGVSGTLTTPTNTANSIVTIDGTQTFTNKTITAPATISTSGASGTVDQDIVLTNTLTGASTVSEGAAIRFNTNAGAGKAEIVLRTGALFNNDTDICLRTQASSGGGLADQVCVNETGKLSANQGLTVTGITTLGATGTSIAKLATYTASLSPVIVAANTCAEQLFTVTGVAAADTVIGVNKPTAQAGLSIGGYRASAINQVGINFCNNTAGAITPTAAQTYSFAVVQ